MKTQETTTKVLLRYKTERGTRQAFYKTARSAAWAPIPAAQADWLLITDPRYALDPTDADIRCSRMNPTTPRFKVQVIDRSNGWASDSEPLSLDAALRLKDRIAEDEYPIIIVPAINC
jgi:hypothetical protein